MTSVELVIVEGPRAVLVDPDAQPPKPGANPGLSCPGSPGIALRDRPESLFGIARNQCPLSAGLHTWGGMTFSGLAQYLRDQFLALTLPIVLIENAETDEVRDLFIRLQAGTPFTTQQVRDA